MIEKIIDWSAHNRAIVLLIYLIISGLGIYAVMNLPVDAIPDLSENQVIVYTEWMGRSPQVVEDQITYPLVSAMQGMAEVKAVRATTMFGMSFVFVIFQDKTDINFARSRVQERLGTVTSQLPPGVTPTLGPDGTGVGHVFWYTVEGEGYDLATLRSVQDWFIRYKLSSVEGVAEIASIGGFVKEFQVDVHPEKLKAYNISPLDVASALTNANNESGGKNIVVTDAEYFIRGTGYLKTQEEIENIPIKNTPNGVPVFIRNVATVQLGGELRRGLLEKNGEGEVVGGIVVMRNGENAQAVIERVREKIREITPGLPKGINIKTAYDRSTLIKEAVGTLERALIEAGIVVAVVVALFLFHFRSIVRILIEIPVATLLAFLFMYLFDISSNIMSLGGIILAIGVIVDSSVVLVENSYRNIARAMEEKGQLSNDEYFGISLQSAKQVGRAIFFSDLIILVSFLPVFLLTGQEGKLFHPLAFTKTFTMLGSAIVVISLIPVLMTMLMRGTFRKEEANPVTNFFQRIYQPIIKLVLRYRKTALALNFLALIVTIPMIIDTGTEFMPPLDEGSLLFMPVMLPNVSIGEAGRILQLQDKIIRSVPEVEYVLGKAGRAETATDNAPLSMIETIILLKPKDQWREGITKKDIILELDSKLQFAGVRNGWTQPIINRINMLSTGVRSEIGLKIFGPNLDTLEQYAVRAEQLLKEVEGAADVVAERNQAGYYLDIQINRETAARYGINVAELSRIIETAIGGEQLGTIYDGRQRFPLRMRYARESRENAEAIKELLIPSNYVSKGSTSQGDPNYAGKEENQQGGMSGMDGNSSATQRTNTSEAGIDYSAFSDEAGNSFIPLKYIADVKVTMGPPMINSENGMLRSVVYLNSRGRDMGSVVDDAKALIEEKLHLPEGYTVAWSGQYENKERAQKTITLIMPAVFIIIFMFLYFTLKDYKEAFVVMLSVPFALIGGVYMIYILDYNFSVAVWVGFIALYGVAVETGVVMVIYLHAALDKKIREAYAGNYSITKEDIYTATVEGSVLRLRPKLMTVFTSMVGLIPVMWSTGTGADVMKPLTAPMIGGLITSALHVLIITPVLFAIMKERALTKGTLSMSRMTGWMKEG